MKSNLSLSALRASVEGTLRRFPASCVFAFLLAAYLIYSIFAENTDGVAVYYLSVGCLMSLMLSLWSEKTERPLTFLVINVVAHALLLADAFVLEFHVTDYSSALRIAHSSAVLGFILGTVFLPFRRAKDDLPAWVFAVSMAFSAALSAVIGLVMTLGTCGLVAGFEGLFDIGVSYKVYECIWAIFMALMPILMFLSRVPHPEEIRVEMVPLSRFLMGTVRYLFIPLAAGYMLVLYAYLLKIIFMWELPRGAVSWLVTAMMVGILAIICILYPAIRQDDLKPFERAVVRWMPLAALPLVVLMTVGIVRRFSDYGITANRLYVMTLNLWFYAVCIGLFLLRARRIHWVFLSFGAIMLLSSAQPLNYYEIARRSITKDVEEIMAKYPPAKLPFDSSNDVQAWAATMPKDVAETACGKLNYLLLNYAKDDWSQWASYTPYIYDFVDTAYTSGYDELSNLSFSLGDVPCSVPEGRTHFVNGSFSNSYEHGEHFLDSDSICRIEIDDVFADERGAKVVVCIDFKDFLKHRKERAHFLYKSEDGRADILLTHLETHGGPEYRYLSLDYMLFE